MRKQVIILLLAAAVISGCTKNSSLNDSTALTGVWNRVVGPSGDQTDIAIGGISGAPDNRVYMCEWSSTASGLYKGYLNGNVITWDTRYNLPKTTIARDGDKLTFDYNVSGSLTTYYTQGSWRQHCGALEEIIRKVAVGLNAAQVIGDDRIISVKINGVSAPLTVLNATTTVPDCNYSVLVDGAYSDKVRVDVTYSTTPLLGSPTTKICTTYLYVSDFVNGCNKYQVMYEGVGAITYTIARM